MPDPGGHQEAPGPGKNSGTPEETGVQKPQREGRPKLWEAVAAHSGLPQHTVKLDRTSGPGTSPPVHLPTRVFTLPEQTKFTQSDYIIDRLIGEGGMGWVYSAKQRCLNRNVAVKAVHSEAAGSPDSRKQFLAEALFIGELDHPNIVPIHELGTNEEGQLFYAMKMVNGIPWSGVIREKTVERNLDILLRVADAIAFAHSRGVLHCDLKPDNIMLGEFGEVYVMDWGLAVSTKALAALGADRKEFFPGGTPAYMPPEFVSGRPEKIGPGSDIYLLGGILYEILTGKPPHPEAALSGAKAVYSETVTHPPDDHAGLTNIAMRALSIEPGERHGDVKQFQNDLRACLQHMDSLLLAESAGQFLDRARSAAGYMEFSQALSGYEQSLKLWPGNRGAREGFEATRMEYARRALAHSDLDLAESLLDQNNPRHQTLLDETGRNRRERNRRQTTLRRMKTSLAFLGLFTFTVLLVAQSWIRTQRNAARYESFINATRLAVQELFSGDWKEVLELQANLQEPHTGWEWEWLDKNSRPAFSGPGKAVPAPRMSRASPDGNMTAWLDENGRIEFRTGEGNWAWEAGAEIGDFRLLADDAGIPTVLLWRKQEIQSRRIEDGAVLRNIVLPEEKETPMKGRLSSNGKRLLRIHAGGQASVLDAGSGQTLAHLSLPGENRAIAGDLSPEGNKAAVILDNNSVMTFDARTGSPLRRDGAQPVRNVLSRIEFINDGKALLLGNFERGVAVFDAATLTPRLSLPLPAPPSAFAVSADGHYLAAGTGEGDLLVQDLMTGNIIWRTRLANQPVAFVSFRKDPETLRIVDRNHLLFELPLKERLPYTVLSRYDYPALHLEEDPVSETIFCARQNGALSQLSLPNGPSQSRNLTQGLTPRFSIAATGSAKNFRLFMGRETGVEVLGADGKLSVWKRMAPVSLLAADAGGKRLAAARRDRLLLFSGEDSSSLGEWELPADLAAMKWIGGGSLLALGCTDGSLWLLDPLAGNFPLKLKLGEPVLALAASPDGKELAVSTQDRDVSILDTRTGLPKQKLHSHEHIVLDMAYSPRQDRLFTASADGRIHIFDTRTWREIVSFQAHRGAVFQLLLCGNGSTLITSGADGEVRLWSGTRTPSDWP